jgi:hypothetical protein
MSTFTQPPSTFAVLAPSLDHDDRVRLCRPAIGWPVRVVLRWAMEPFGWSVAGTVLGIAQLGTTGTEPKAVLVLTEGSQLHAVTLAGIERWSRI